MDGVLFSILFYFFRNSLKYLRNSIELRETFFFLNRRRFAYISQKQIEYIFVWFSLIFKSNRKYARTFQMLIRARQKHWTIPQDLSNLLRGIDANGAEEHSTWNYTRDLSATHRNTSSLSEDIEDKTNLAWNCATCWPQQQPLPRQRRLCGDRGAIRAMRTKRRSCDRPMTTNLSAGHVVAPWTLCRLRRRAAASPLYPPRRSIQQEQFSRADLRHEWRHAVHSLIGNSRWRTNQLRKIDKVVWLSAQDAWLFFDSNVFYFQRTNQQVLANPTSRVYSQKPTWLRISMC